MSSLSISTDGYLSRSYKTLSVSSNGYLDKSLNIIIPPIIKKENSAGGGIIHYNNDYKNLVVNKNLKLKNKKLKIEDEEIFSILKIFLQCQY